MSILHGRNKRSVVSGVSSLKSRKHKINIAISDKPLICNCNIIGQFCKIIPLLLEISSTVFKQDEHVQIPQWLSDFSILSAVC